MTSRFKIEFGDHRHRRTGYLSNAARYSFSLENKEWPSVEHYICAQPFKGEPLEEELRRAPSPWRLHFLVRGKRSSCEKDGRIVKKYSKYISQTPHARGASAEGVWYQKSITNKFFQNQRIMERLLNTGNSILIDVTCPYTGPILEKIRSQCRQERFQKKFMYSPRELETAPDIKDISNSSLTPEDFALINGIINASWKNVKKSDKKCMYVEFIENTLSELYPKRATFIIMLYRTRSPPMIEQMPYFSHVINQIYEIFRKEDPYQEYDLAGSYLIGEILRWRKMYASPSESDQFLRIVAPNFSVIKEPPPPVARPPKAEYSEIIPPSSEESLHASLPLPSLEELLQLPSVEESHPPSVEAPPRPPPSLEPALRASAEGGTVEELLQLPSSAEGGTVEEPPSLEPLDALRASAEGGTVEELLQLPSSAEGGTVEEPPSLEPLDALRASAEGGTVEELLQLPSSNEGGTVEEPPSLEPLDALRASAEGGTVEELLQLPSSNEGGTVEEPPSLEPLDALRASAEGGTVEEPPSLEPLDALRASAEGGTVEERSFYPLKTDQV